MTPHALSSFAANPRLVRLFRFFEHPIVATALFLFAILTVVILAQSCSTLAIPSADTFNKKVAVAEVATQTAYDLAADLLIAKKISVDDAKAARDKLADARATIAAAKVSFPVDPKLSENNLASALQIVNALQSYLQSKQVTPP